MLATSSLRQCAAVIIRRGNGELLVIRQSYGQGFWGVPGGAVDAGETPQQAAVREAREEVGVEVKLNRIIGIYTLRGGGRPEIRAYVYEGAAYQEQFELRIDASEIAAALWLKPEELALRSPLLPDVSAALEDLAAHRFGVIRTVQRKVTLPSLNI